MVTIRKASPADADEICKLHRESIRRLCATAYPAEKIAAWAESLTPERYLPAMHALEFFVAEDRWIGGFVILDPGGAELNALYLHPRAVGRGVGRRLLEYAEDVARNNAVTKLQLRSTLNAAGFYEACGFSRLHETIHEHPAGVELECVLMTKVL